MNEAEIARVNTLVRQNSRTDLIRMCKEKNLNCSGTKHDMAVRLIGGQEKAAVVIEPIVKKIVIRRNGAGLWEYDGLVFDDNSRNVVGRWEDGVLQPLRRADIEKCKQYKFRYTLPQVLDERQDPHRTMAQELSSDDEEEEEEEDGPEE